VLRYVVIAVIAVGLLGAGAAAYVVLSDEDPPEKRGSATEEFDPSATPEAPKPPERKVIAEPWPTFGYDLQRTKVSPYPHRPPYRRTWRVDARDTLEFPPSAAYGNLYVAQQKGLFFALNGKTGKPVFKTKNFKRCAASSPTLDDGTIYQAYMDFTPCPQGASNPTGFVIAMDAETGRQKWRYKGQPFESSPLLRNGILYVGSWDGNVHAIRAKTGRRVWTHQTGNRVNTSAAYSQGRIFIANQDGTLFALSARTGRRIWSASQATEFFYAAPAVAYGRVFIGSSDGTMYAYGARTGKLLWARPLGTYIYSSAAISEKKVYAGSYDGKFYALDAATGDVRWQRTMASAVHAPPVVMRGLVYAATCATCGSAASRFVKMGRDGTTAFNARNGRRVWHNNSGKYASPIIADQNRVYLVGRSFLYALERPRAKKRK
jgi:outer membrane protein assembly factor BamB